MKAHKILSLLTAVTEIHLLALSKFLWIPVLITMTVWKASRKLNSKNEES